MSTKNNGERIESVRGFGNKVKELVDILLLCCNLHLIVFQVFFQNCLESSNGNDVELFLAANVNRIWTIVVVVIVVSFLHC
jgi:hypothetical protein